MLTAISLPSVRQVVRMPTPSLEQVITSLLIAHSEPQVVANPPSLATLRTDLSTLTGSAITFSFSMPVRDNVLT
jgi:hypothetical protein